MSMIGIQTEVPASVAAQCNQRERRGWLRRPVCQAAKIAVDVSGVTLERRSSARATQDVVADILPGFFQTRASLWC